MEPHEQILQKIAEQEQKLNELIALVAKVRKYFLIIIWVSVALFIIPLIGMLFVIPSFINTYTSSLNGLL